MKLTITDWLQLTIFMNETFHFVFIKTSLKSLPKKTKLST